MSDPPSLYICYERHNPNEEELRGPHRNRAPEDFSIEECVQFAARWPNNPCWIEDQDGRVIAVVHGTPPYEKRS